MTEYTSILQGELDENVFNAPNKTAARRAPSPWPPSSNDLLGG